MLLTSKGGRHLFFRRKTTLVLSCVPFKKLIVFFSCEVQISSLECSSQNVHTLIFCLVEKGQKCLVYSLIKVIFEYHCTDSVTSRSKNLIENQKVKNQIHRHLYRCSPTNSSDER